MASSIDKMFEFVTEYNLKKEVEEKALTDLMNESKEIMKSNVYKKMIEKMSGSFDGTFGESKGKKKSKDKLKFFIL